MKTSQVVKRVDKFFAPDITVLVDSDGLILSRRALTVSGTEYMAHRAVLGENYDTVLLDSGLCIESVQI